MSSTDKDRYNFISPSFCLILRQADRLDKLILIGKFLESKKVTFAVKRKKLDIFGGYILIIGTANITGKANLKLKLLFYSR